jgi:type II secretory pathway pseudopilin PulG
MQEKAKKGFTLIELVIALAILITVFAISFSAIANFYRLRLVYDQEIVLQQNFRFAIDRITDELRQANKDPAAPYNIIIAPDDNDKTGNAMNEELRFSKYDSAAIPPTIDIYYLIKPHGGGCALYREEHNHITGALIDGTSQPVTEDMKELVKIYFVRQGGKVVIIMVGTLKYFGKENIITYTSLVYSRNSNVQD